MMEGERLEALVGFERRVNWAASCFLAGCRERNNSFPGASPYNIRSRVKRDGILGAMGTLCFILVLQWMRLDVHL